MWFFKEKSPQFRLKDQWYGDAPSADRKEFEEQLVRQIATVPCELWEATDSGYKAITGNNTNNA